NGRHHLSGWLKTDDVGTTQCGVGRGTHRVFVSHENWKEEQTFDVKSLEPVSIEFHKPYEHRRQIRVQLAQAGRSSNYSDVKITAIEHSSRGRKSSDLNA